MAQEQHIIIKNSRPKISKISPRPKISKIKKKTKA